MAKSTYATIEELSGNEFVITQHVDEDGNGEFVKTEAHRGDEASCKAFIEGLKSGSQE